MKTFKVTYLHTDGFKRKAYIQAYNKERAKGRFEVNWGLDMKILSIEKV